MPKEENKEIESIQKKSVFENLMNDPKFIGEILNTNNGKEIIEKFDSYGIDLNKIQFSDLCKILAQKLTSDNKNLEVNSINSPISVDYPKNENAVVNFED